jgi:hypothetical protein
MGSSRLKDGAVLVTLAINTVSFAIRPEFRAFIAGLSAGWICFYLLSVLIVILYCVDCFRRGKAWIAGVRAFRDEAAKSLAEINNKLQGIQDNVVASEKGTRERLEFAVKNEADKRASEIQQLRQRLEDLIKNFPPLNL